MYDFPASPTTGQTVSSGGVSWTYDGTKWKASATAAVVVPPVAFAFPFASKPPASGVVNVPIAWAISVPASLAGTVTYATTKATANTMFTVNRISGGVTTAIGTVTLTPTSNTSNVLAGAGGSLVAGDTLQLATPAQDASLADCGITIYAART